MQNQTISKLYIYDNKSKLSSNSTDILESAKYFYKKLCTKETTPKTVINKFLSKIPNRKKIQNVKFVRLIFSEATKSINPQKNDKFPGNDGLTAQSYEHFLN